MNRNRGLEWMKLMAIIAVAFQHTVENNQLAPIVILTDSGVPVFVIISCWFAFDSGIRQRSGRSLVQTGLKRFVHLYGLFLLWNSMVFSLRLANDIFVSKTASVSFDSDKFFLSAYGNALWFLPFIAGANLLCFVIAYLVMRARWFAAGVAVVGLGAGVALMCWKGFGELSAANYFLSVSKKAVPSVLLLIGFRCFALLWPSLVPCRKFLVPASFVLLAFGSWGIQNFGRSLFVWETLMGCGLTILAASVDSSGFRHLNPNLSLWIYLAHAPVIQITKDLLRALGHSWPATTAIIEVVSFTFFIGSLVIAYWLLGFVLPLKRLLLFIKKEKPSTFVELS